MEVKSSPVLIGQLQLLPETSPGRFSYKEEPRSTIRAVFDKVRPYFLVERLVAAPILPASTFNLLCSISTWSARISQLPLLPNSVRDLLYLITQLRRYCPLDKEAYRDHLEHEIEIQTKNGSIRAHVLLSKKPTHDYFIVPLENGIDYKTFDYRYIKYLDKHVGNTHSYIENFEEEGMNFVFYHPPSNGAQVSSTADVELAQEAIIRYVDQDLKRALENESFKHTMKERGLTGDTSLRDPSKGTKFCYAFPGQDIIIKGLETDEYTVENQWSWKLLRKVDEPHLDHKIEIQMESASVSGHVLFSRKPTNNYFIVALGNGMDYKPCYEIYTRELKDLDVNFVFYNYPSVGDSQGLPLKEHMEEAQRAIVRYVDQGLKQDLENESFKQTMKEKGLLGDTILRDPRSGTKVCYGFSIGGGALGGLEKEGFEVENQESWVIVFDRTFSSLSLAAEGIVHRVSCYSYRKSRMARCIIEWVNRVIKAVIYFFNWELQPEKFAKSDKFSHKLILQYGNVDQVLCDGPISPEASLARSLESAPSAGQVRRNRFPGWHMDFKIEKLVCPVQKEGRPLSEAEEKLASLRKK